MWEWLGDGGKYGYWRCSVRGGGVGVNQAGRSRWRLRGHSGREGWNTKERGIRRTVGFTPHLTRT
jgi:hypothetical protein